ncbi:nickel pincer cofactor biosynthesis protein LarC [Extibacter muris]|uniref:nickel pincer cofactor biosynthesis protein LarC n=1 Tax=Extibacter muris TaxID=1796622 RepID=UPI001D08931C|nr:nickel pincer cofactor biosynthesis protein LarC [Extibacter muris]MCB6201945.1 nickel pincer cofactor biosynthesis protein LarC [Extibacter muris]MCQ4663382.1 nickel pincer cofactor biosynthesis protein LarC [Extibacter muris]MCQ4692578.1 nickel pincer cofactor biosynthesis protein LarC [Extibacter muris]
MRSQTGKTLYLECCSGISGDMMVAALLDLGADEEVLEQVLESLPVGGFRTKVRRVKKAGLDVCDFDVILEDAYENHDHDMSYLHGHEHVHEEAHGHAHEVGHGHPHPQAHGSGAGLSHAHVHRGLGEILHIIGQAHMTDGAKALAEKIFRILADAEAKAHGVPANQVHFHEVGAVDSIVDIISASVCLDNLGVQECIVPVLYEGCGTIRCQHGVLPVPVPAVANIVEAYGLKLCLTQSQGEFVTPTGAAIAAAVRTSKRLPASFTVRKIGMGAGKREYDRPGILRAMLIEGAGASNDTDCIWKLETNIDDCTGEALGYVMERLMEEGARDVNYMPVYMKKNRPAYQLNIICTEEDITKLEQIVFEETTTIGIRRQRMERSVLARTVETIRTSIGEARVKVCTVGSGVRKYPEYESVAALSRASGRSYQDVYALIARECNDSGQ